MVRLTFDPQKKDWDQVATQQMLSNELMKHVDDEIQRNYVMTTFLNVSLKIFSFPFMIKPDENQRRPGHQRLDGSFSFLDFSARGR